MSRDEVRFAEAVAALTARLEAWGVPEPHEKAHTYVADMRRQGWRPVGYRYEEPTSASSVRPMPAPADALALARAELAQAKARTCSHGVPPKRCAETHEEEA